MKLTRTREHVINMGNYESLRIGASVEIEVSDSANPEEYQTACDRGDALLDQALAVDLAEAQKLTYVKDSYSLSWKETKSNA